MKRTILLGLSMVCLVALGASCGGETRPEKPASPYNDQWKGTMELPDTRLVDFVLNIYQTPITARHDQVRVFLELHVTVDGAPAIFGGIGGAKHRADPSVLRPPPEDPSREWVHLFVADTQDPTTPRAVAHNAAYARFVGEYALAETPTDFFELIGENFGTVIKGFVWAHAHQSPHARMRVGSFSASRSGAAPTTAVRDSQIETETFLFETDYTKKACPDCGGDSSDSFMLK